jgi:hypothetical protein
MLNYSSDAPFFEWYELQDYATCEGEVYPCTTDRVLVSIEMKSFGSRNDQIWDALIVSNVIFPNSFVNSITIKSPTDKCEYVIFGAKNYFEDYDLEIRDIIENQIALGTCS